MRLMGKKAAISETSRTFGALVAAGLTLAGCVGGAVDAPMSGPAGGSSGVGTGGAGSNPQGSVDPGRVGIHRLNNTEYNNTVRDLLGTALAPASKWLAEEGLHFDNTATALGMTPGQYEAYMQAASDLMTEALASPTQS